MQGAAPEQGAWPARIAERIGANLVVAPEDLDDILGDRGGRVTARRVLGPEWRALLNELNASSAA